MNKYLKIVLYGLGVWVVPFLVSFIIYPLKQSGNPLFESLMAVVITATVVLLILLYFKPLENHFLKEGVLIGWAWLIISIAVDLLFFTGGPMAMSLTVYTADIGVTYLIIPLVTVGMGYLIDSKVGIFKGG
ncbi:MAG: hypothetical protein Q8N08_03695 [Methanobacteriaceae archaeon]|nr:hypothetical protein [Methanobacteriaceae archaeon]